MVDKAAPVNDRPLLASAKALSKLIVLALPVIFSTSTPAAAIRESCDTPPLLDSAQVNSLGVAAGLIVRVTESALANFRFAAVKVLKSLAEIVLMPPLAVVLIVAAPPLPLVKVRLEPSLVAVLTRLSA